VTKGPVRQLMLVFQNLEYGLYGYSCST